ncbi:MAG: DUF3566 domain-containing protein [Bowdeniella nasicola]|nr:DUF3566 domain-containing protein [Bowdeniella nasicola]
MSEHNSAAEQPPTLPPRPKVDSPTTSDDRGKTALQTSKVSYEPKVRRGTGQSVASEFRIIQRVDPWSVMKLGFLLSIALGLMTVIAAAMSWLLLDSFGVFSSISSIIGEIDTSSGEISKLMSYLHFDKIISMATIIAIINVLLLTALMTIGAFIYNIVASLVGGIHVTLTEE